MTMRLVECGPASATDARGNVWFFMKPQSFITDQDSPDWPFCAACGREFDVVCEHYWFTELGEYGEGLLGVHASCVEADGRVYRGPRVSA
jgi:hypothetical protein